MIRKQIADYLYLGLPNAVTAEGLTRQEVEDELANIHNRKRVVREQNAIYIEEFNKLAEIEEILMTKLNSMDGETLNNI